MKKAILIGWKDLRVAFRDRQNAPREVQGARVGEHGDPDLWRERGKQPRCLRIRCHDPTE